MFNFFSRIKKEEMTVEESTCTALIPYPENKNEFRFNLLCSIGSQIWIMHKNKPIQVSIYKIEIDINIKGIDVFYYWNSTEYIIDGFFIGNQNLFFSKEDLLNSL